MACVKAVIFDYIGTLINCRGYTMDASRENLYASLAGEGFVVAKNKFLEAYDLAHEKYRKVRYEELREVTNAVWVAEALCSLGFKVAADDYRIKDALNVFFKAYVDTFELRYGVKKLLKESRKRCKVALISNFTYAPVIYKSLRQLELNAFFDTVVVSQEVGWRKPSSRIFQNALNCLQVDADEAVYIGDSPIEDIRGAKQAGLKTIFIASQFNTIRDLEDSQQKPDFVAKNFQSISENFAEIISLETKE